MTFEELGYIIIKDLYDVKNHTKNTSDLFAYTKTISNTGDFDEQTPFAPSFYGDLEMWKIQYKILEKMEKITGLKLYPTYNYFRIYNSSSILKPHTDRPACEISVTMNIGYDGDYNWPIWIKDNNNKNVEVILEPGDGLIYQGCVNEHWRDDADKRVLKQSQVFLHYVNQNGPYEHCINDKVKI